jgi:hypothetical protein
MLLYDISTNYATQKNYNVEGIVAPYKEYFYFTEFRGYNGWFVEPRNLYH